MCAKVRKKLFSTIAKEEVIFFAKPQSLFPVRLYHFDRMITSSGKYGYGILAGWLLPFLSILIVFL